VDWLNEIVFWHWWILAGMLLILELTSPVFFFLWLGFSAAAVGFLLLVFPQIPVTGQLILFGVLSFVTILAWRRHGKARPPSSDQSQLNTRGQQYMGQVFSLEKPIVNGVGKVVVNDSTWGVKGPDLPAGARVRVVGVDGVVFIVENADPS
jgi:hypothetical protein